MRRILISTALVGGLSVLASAQVNFTSNFDSSAYTPGILAGQDGWVAGSGPGTSNVPAVSNANSLSPSQSVFLTTATGTSASSFSSTGRTFAAGAPSTDTQILTASADIFVDSLAGNDRYFGIGFGTGNLATTGSLAIALGGNGLRGGGGSYAAYNGLTTGQLQARTTADFVGRWIRVSLTADRGLTTNNVVFSFSGLGTSGGAATESFTRSVNFGTTNLTNVQVFNDWSTTSTIQGAAYIDNVSFGANPVNAVPEPATLAALGLGAAAMLRRRRK